MREAILKTGAVPPEFDMAKIDRIVAERYMSKDGKTGFKKNVSKRPNY